jgi:hypothetical protein
MGVILQILGGLFLVTILMIAGGVLFLRFKLKQFLKGIESAVGGMRQSMVQPSRIGLISVANASWDESEVVDIERVFARLGFDRIGIFDVDPLEGLRIGAWVKAAEGMYAVVYRHTAAGVWFDFVTKYADGTSRTYSNSARGGALDQRPGAENVFRVELGPAELYAFAIADRPKKATRGLGIGDFAADFEKAYADEMDWRASRGGVSADEIRAIGALAGEGVSEDVLGVAGEIARRRAMEHLNDRLLSELKSTTKMSVARWEEIEDRLIFIHDGLDRGAICEMAEAWIGAEFDTDALIEDEPGTTTSRGFFARLNGALPESRRFERIERLHQPIEADVYVGPLGDGGGDGVLEGDHAPVERGEWNH